MWKKALIIFIIFNLCLGAYFHFERWFKYGRYNLWSLVPETAIAVFENPNLISNWQRLDSVATWQNLANIESLRLIGERVNVLDSLMGDGTLTDITTNNPALISLHITSKSSFDFLFQIELKNVESHTAVWTAIKTLEDQGYRLNTRNYLGHQLTEITKDRDSFTYIFYQNFFIGSFTPFLVEDVIRTFESDDLPTFKETHNPLFSLVKLQNDDGNLYLNSAKLGDLVGIFSDDLKFESNELNGLTKSTFLDISLSNQNILLNGFTLNGTGSNSLLSTFNENPSTVFGMANLIPENTALLYHLTATNFPEWGKSLSLRFTENDPAISDIRQKYDIDLRNFYQWMDREVGLAEIESSDLEKSDKLVFINTNDPSEGLKQMNRLATVSLEQDTLYVETFNDIEITQVNVNEFPQLLFGSLFQGFDQTFYSFLGSHLVISDNIETIKEWYTNYQSDNTWGKSVKTANFLETTLQEANLSLFVDTNRAWNKIRDNLSDEWKHFLEENGRVFHRFEMAALQFSYIDNKFYTSLVLHQPEITANGSNGYVSQQAVEFAAPLVTKPHIVRNHNDRSFETLVQDSLYNVYLIDAKGEVLWGDSINAEIQTGIAQIDYYKNGKLQYVFATEQHLHIIDRNGDYLPNYPLQLKDGISVQSLSVVDYDKSKRYRFMIGDAGGDIYLYDKEGKNLTGWTPQAISSSLAYPPFHVRVRTRDRFIAIQNNGMANIYNRPGRQVDGFPLDLKADMTSPSFLDIGSSFENTSLTTITKDGEIIAFSLTGNILKREQLYKPDPETTFYALPDALGKSLLFVRKTGRRLAILDVNGELLFEKDYLSSEDLAWQYYNFGGSKEIVVVLDRLQEFAYLYNLKGQLINYQPIESSHEIGLLYFASQSKFQLYKNYQNEAELLEFSY